MTILAEKASFGTNCTDLRNNILPKLPLLPKNAIRSKRREGKSVVTNGSVNAMMLLKDSLAEAQNSVRAYDTKAQIVGVGYIFALNVIGQINAQITEKTSADTLTIIVAWLIVILPIMLFGYVLYPVRKSERDSTHADAPNHMLFLHPEKYGSVEELKAAANQSDATDEIAFELLKMSELRESKRKRFVRGLIGAGLAFAVLFANQIYVSSI